MQPPVGPVTPLTYISRDAQGHLANLNVGPLALRVSLYHSLSFPNLTVKNACSSVPLSQLAMSTPLKSSLTITLMEPLVILHTTDIAGAQSLPEGIAPPSIVRGLLALDLSKASRISCIQVELQATSFSSWSEGLSYARSLPV